MTDPIQRKFGGVRNQKMVLCCVCGVRCRPKTYRSVSASRKYSTILSQFNKYGGDAIGVDCYDKLQKAITRGEKVVKLPSRIDPNRDCGDGAMALVPLKKGALATHYGGIFISEAQAKRKPIEQRTHDRKFIKGVVIDGSTHFRTGPNQGLGGALNEDTDAPNCKYKESTKALPTRIELRTLRDIPAGEELTVYYGRNYDDSLVQGRSKVGRPRKKLRGVALPGFQQKVMKNRIVRRAVVIE
jgi:hypothetical protein